MTIIYNGSKTGGSISDTEPSTKLTGVSQQIKEVEERLKGAGLIVDMQASEYSGHVVEMVQALDPLPDFIAPCGGDGTVHEVINGLYARQGESGNVVIAVIPFGTGNNLAFDMGITSVDSAVRSIIAGEVMPIDVQEVRPLLSSNSNGTLVNGTEKDSLVGTRVPHPAPPYLSMNMVGWGVPSTVVKLAEKWRVCGKVPYDAAAVTKIAENSNVFQAKIVLCGVQTEDGELQEQELSETSWCLVQSQVNLHMGAKMPFCPAAKLTDGLIDVVVAEGTYSRSTTVGLFNAAKKGEHCIPKNDFGVRTFQCKGFRLEPLEAEPLQGRSTVNIDGELKGDSPCVVECKPGAFEFIVGCMPPVIQLESII